MFKKMDFRRYRSHLNSNSTYPTPPLNGWLRWLHSLCLTQTVNSDSSSGYGLFDGANSLAVCRVGSPSAAGPQTLQ